MSELAVQETAIPGLYLVDLVVNTDERGTFTEVYQTEKLGALGLPPLHIKQANRSTNYKTGATRGVHAEPWNKLISIAHGQVFGAWVDLRAGATFGTVVTAELGFGQAVYVPKGVGNSYQTLADDTSYFYMVDGLWQPGVTYPAANLFDPAFDIHWPIARERAIVSEKDQDNPMIADIVPVEVD